ncbi:MAG: hypothetical protein NTX92_09155 [Euryarchaeota archaeon]|nr:hypothetical protein [Euryarchaeota archaeon]
MSQAPARYIGTHSYQWKPRDKDDVPRREKNLAVYRDLERRKQEKHNENWFKVNGKLPPLTSAQMKSGARRVA